MLEGWIHLMLTMEQSCLILLSGFNPDFGRKDAALTVACDISIYASRSAQATVGTGEIAMAIGPNALLTFENGMSCQIF